MGQPVRKKIAFITRGKNKWPELKVVGRELDDMDASGHSLQQDRVDSYFETDRVALLVGLLLACGCFIAALRVNTFAADRFFELGQMARSASDYHDARKYYSQSGEWGNPNGSYELGMLYFVGLGGEKSIKGAITYHTAAAAGGNPKAMHFLGNAFYQGELGTVDFERAIFWYRKAAAANHSESIVKLATMHFNGMGLPKNMSRGISLFEKALEKGSPTAAYFLGIASYYGLGVAINRQLSLDYLKQAASKGNRDALSAIRRLNFD